eukprot:201205-Lingulodinium_polyedra.AAC.1
MGLRSTGSAGPAPPLGNRMPANVSRARCPTSSTKSKNARALQSNSPGKTADSTTYLPSKPR